MLLTHHLRITNDATRLPVRCDVRPAGPAGAGSPAGRRRARSSTARSPTSATRCTATSPTSTSTPCSTGSSPSTCERVEQDRRPRPLPPGRATGPRCSRRVTTSPTASRRSRPGRPRSTWPRWTASGIATSLLSISSPGVYLGDEAAARDLAREVNEIGRRAVVDHPGRFGLFASLPLPDVDAAIAEIAYCCDRLDVDGFALLTNVGGTYLGDPSWEPVFRELEPSAGSGVHPPDLAGVLGAHVARAAPTDARVLLRHDPRRGRPGAQRHHRSSPRHRVHHPARRSDAADDRRPGQRLLPAARRRPRRRRAPRPRPAPLRPGRLPGAPSARRAC